MVVDGCGDGVCATVVGLGATAVGEVAAVGSTQAQSASAPIIPVMVCTHGYPRRGAVRVVALGVFLSNIRKSSCKDEHQDPNHDDHCQRGLSCGGNGNIPD